MDSIDRGLDIRLSEIHTNFQKGISRRALANINCEPDITGRREGDKSHLKTFYLIEHEDLNSQIGRQLEFHYRIPALLVRNIGTSNIICYLSFIKLLKTIKSSLNHPESLHDL